MKNRLIDSGIATLGAIANDEQIFWD
jgi:hypothetical protein